MDSLVGRKLGKYQIESLLGRGGMATVYRAHDPILNRSVAIKVLDPALAMDAKAVERFKREAVTSANLEHPSIVRVYDVQQEGSIYYIAMRYVQGTTLRDILRDNGALPLDAVVNIVKPIAAALHYAHRHGVIHRDVKPGNILVEPDGTVLLTDFGIARAGDAPQAALTATGQVMGTADYLAPEQISGRPAEPRSDIYSLGVVLYEMLTGVTPFVGEHTASILYKQVHDAPPPLRSVNSRIPSELQPIMDRVLAKNPTLRYSDALDLAHDLEDTAQWLPPGSPWLSRSKGMQTVAVSPTYRQNGKRVSSGPVSIPPNGTRAVAKPQTGPKPRVSQPYESYERTYEPEVITPPVGTRRLLVPVVALLLIGVGAVILAAATGLIHLGGASPNPPRFAAAGAVTYNGPLRTGNGPDMHIPKALQPIAIDGDLADWAGAPSGPFPAPYVTWQKGRQWGGDDDLSASFLFAWDDQNFYIGVTVTDNLHVQFDGTRSYDLFKGDDIEVWFDTDLANDFARNEANEDDFQFGLSPGNFGNLGPEGVFWNPEPRTAARNALIQVAAQPRTVDNGYVLEAAVPWSALGGYRPKAGQAVGFAASAGDNDQQDVPIQEIMVSTVPRLQYRAPLTFGNLFF